MPLYTSTSDPNLLRDIMLQSGKVFGRQWVLGPTTGTMGTPGAAAAIAISGTYADDEFNGNPLYIVDDNSKLCTVDIDDTAANTSITVDTTSALLVEDESTPGTFTASGVYDLYILGAEKFLGFSDQQLDVEEETVEFESGAVPVEVLREDTIKNVLGISGNLRNFGANLMAEPYALTQYGDQTNQIQQHGGGVPALRGDWALRIFLEDVNGFDWNIYAFKTNFFSNGAVNLSEQGYKVTPYRAKWYEDTLRDSRLVNKWKIIQATQ